MKLGILLCDDHYPDSIPKFGHYNDAFNRMFGEHVFTHFQSYRCFEGKFPASSGACDVWLVTGSKWGVYDSDAWIQTLRTFIQTCFDEKRPMLGICFGHQMLHHALGGKVEKSPLGWGMGVYPITTSREMPAFASSLPRKLNLIACHQDQVVSLASGFSTLAGSSFCPFAITHFEDQVLTLQCHPEFTADFLLQLIERLREKASNTTVDNAIAALVEHGEGDREEAIALIFRFCEQFTKTDQ